jgi:transmembrane sensor
MENNQEYYINLITRYLAGELAPVEIQELFDWVELYPENLTIFINYCKIWNEIEKEKIGKIINVDDEWVNFNLKIKHIKSEQDNKSKLIRSNFNNVNNRKTYLSFARIAAMLIFVVIASVIIYLFSVSNKDKTLVAKDRFIEYALPDESYITLNSGSELIYPEKFGKHERKVKFKGEAYFNVKHNTKKPFTISADNVRIQVLGTSFYINTNISGGNMEVILTTGRLAVFYKNKPNDPIFLSPGEKAMINKKTCIIKKTINNDLNYMAWRNKKIVFFNNTMSEIISTLNRVYNSNIIIADNKICNCRLTATFDNQTLESVLNVIKKTLDINIIQTETSIELSGNGCR